MDLACLPEFQVRSICQRLPTVATTGLHKGSIVCPGSGGWKRAVRDLTVGCPDLAAQSMRAALVDEYHLFVTPHPGGKRLFD